MPMKTPFQMLNWQLERVKDKIDKLERWAKRDESKPLDDKGLLDDWQLSIVSEALLFECQQIPLLFEEYEHKLRLEVHKRIKQQRRNAEAKENET